MLGSVGAGDTQSLQVAVRQTFCRHTNIAVFDVAAGSRPSALACFHTRRLRASGRHVQQMVQAALGGWEARMQRLRLLLMRCVLQQAVESCRYSCGTADVSLVTKQAQHTVTCCFVTTSCPGNERYTDTIQQTPAAW